MQLVLGSQINMKITSIFIALLMCATSIYSADSDLRKGIDFTGLTSATAAQHNQLVDNGTIATNKALVLITNALPDTTTNPRYTNWVWLDARTSPGVLKVYYSAGGGGEANWVAASVAAGSITTTKIADGAVAYGKIAANAIVASNIVVQSITGDRLTPATLTYANIAASNIVRYLVAYGAIDGPQITNGAIQSYHINAQTIYGTNLVNNTITSNQLAVGAIIGTNIGIGAVTATNIANSTILGTNIAAGTITTNKLAFYEPEFFNGTANTIVGAGGQNTWTHGLSGIPTRVEVTLLCVATDSTAAYAVGDEINVGQISFLTSGAYAPAFTIVRSATTITVVRGNVAGLYINKKDTGALTDTVANTNKYVIKARAWFQP